MGFEPLSCYGTGLTLLVESAESAPARASSDCSVGGSPPFFWYTSSERRNSTTAQLPRILRSSEPRMRSRRSGLDSIGSYSLSHKQTTNSVRDWLLTTSREKQCARRTSLSQFRSKSKQHAPRNRAERHGISLCLSWSQPCRSCPQPCMSTAATLCGSTSCRRSPSSPAPPLSVRWPFYRGWEYVCKFRLRSLRWRDIFSILSL